MAPAPANQPSMSTVFVPSAVWGATPTPVSVPPSIFRALTAPPPPRENECSECGVQPQESERSSGKRKDGAMGVSRAMACASHSTVARQRCITSSVYAHNVHRCIHRQPSHVRCRQTAGQRVASTGIAYLLARVDALAVL
jgi:hypothetical protein